MQSKIFLSSTGAIPKSLNRAIALHNFEGVAVGIYLRLDRLTLHQEVFVGRDILLGFFSGNPAQLSVGDGMAILFACVPIMLGGLLSAIAQGRVAAASVSAIVAKKPDDYMKGVIMCGIVEFYAILSLVGTILMLMYAL